MDVESLKKLPPDAQREYIQIEKRFTSDCWAWVRHWAQEQIDEATTRAALAENWEMNRQNVGFIQALTILLGKENEEFAKFNDMLSTVHEEEQAEAESHASDLQL